MRTIHQWLNEYGESHTNEINKLIHWICVPAIFFSITGLLYCVKLPFFIADNLQLNVAMIVLLLTMIYYLSLSIKIGIGMLLFGFICLGLCYFLETVLPFPLWIFCIAMFVLAWIGQFYGHRVEGKKPSFFKDIQFLLIGPMWLMSFVYKKMGISF
ncbi:MAG TPA: Mpo1-like protein [Ginsengibacter sp.]